MSKVLVERILQQYGHRVEGIANVQKGYRNESYAVQVASGKTLNLILYKRESDILQRIKNANRIGDTLAEAGLPARSMADRRIIVLSAEGYTRYAVLYHYLPGHTIPWEAYTREHIKNLGGAMGRMHTILRGRPKGDLPLVTDECSAMVERMAHYFADEGVRMACISKLQVNPPRQTKKYQMLLERCPTLPSQPLHMDLVRGNVLFDNAEVTGILDFEKTAWGPTIFDVARTYAFLLVDGKYKTPGQIHKYFLYSGYQKRGDATITNRQLLQPLVDLFLLYDFYKFLRHNPYQDLGDNQHFVRTRDFLLKRNIISLVKNGKLSQEHKKRG